jgi:hypothetical protein
MTPIYLWLFVVCGMCVIFNFVRQVSLFVNYLRAKYPSEWKLAKHGWHELSWAADPFYLVYISIKPSRNDALLERRQKEFLIAFCVIVSYAVSLIFVIPAYRIVFG